MEKEKINVQVAHLKPEATFEELVETITMLQKQVENNEIENVTFDADMNWDSYEGLEFRAQRLEIDEEFKTRLELIAKHKEKQRLAALSKQQRKDEKDKIEYERLKKKFEG